MQWAGERVRSAEKAATAHERRLQAERVFRLRLRAWDAEMKLRGMAEEREEDGKEGERPSVRAEHHRRKESPMGRLRKLARDARQMCLKGLAGVVER